MILHHSSFTSTASELIDYVATWLKVFDGSLACTSGSSLDYKFGSIPSPTRIRANHNKILSTCWRVKTTCNSSKTQCQSNLLSYVNMIEKYGNEICNQRYSKTQNQPCTRNDRTPRRDDCQARTLNVHTNLFKTTKFITTTWFKRRPFCSEKKTPQQPWLGAQPACWHWAPR